MTSTIEQLAARVQHSANGAAASKPAQSMITRLTGAWRAAQPALLATSGLACFDVAAFLHSGLVGFVVTGASLLVLEWRLKG